MSRNIQPPRAGGPTNQSSPPHPRPQPPHLPTTEDLFEETKKLHDQHRQDRRQERRQIFPPISHPHSPPANVFESRPERQKAEARVQHLIHVRQAARLAEAEKKVEAEKKAAKEAEKEELRRAEAAKDAKRREKRISALEENSRAHWAAIEADFLALERQRERQRESERKNLGAGIGMGGGMSEGMKTAVVNAGEVLTAPIAKMACNMGVKRAERRVQASLRGKELREEGVLVYVSPAGGEGEKSEKVEKGLGGEEWDDDDDDDFKEGKGEEGLGEWEEMENPVGKVKTLEGGL